MIERIDKLMPKSHKLGGIRKKIETAMIADTVMDVLRLKFGDAANKMRVRRVKSGVATVTCDNSVLAEEVRLYEPDLITEINTRSTKEKIDRIVATT